MINSLKMALLSRRLRKTTRAPRYREIAALFRAFARMIWGSSYHYLSEEHIRGRVRRVKREHGAELRRQIAFTETYRKALARGLQVCEHCQKMIGLDPPTVCQRPNDTPQQIARPHQE